MITIGAKKKIEVVSASCKVRSARTLNMVDPNRNSTTHDMRRQIVGAKTRRIAPSLQKDADKQDVDGEASPGDDQRRNAGQHKIFAAGVEEGETHIDGKHAQYRRRRRRAFVLSWGSIQFQAGW